MQELSPLLFASCTWLTYHHPSKFIFYSAQNNLSGNTLSLTCLRTFWMAARCHPDEMQAVPSAQQSAPSAARPHLLPQTKLWLLQPDSSTASPLDFLSSLHEPLWLSPRWLSFNLLPGLLFAVLSSLSPTRLIYHFLQETSVTFPARGTPLTAPRYFHHYSPQVVLEVAFLCVPLDSMTLWPNFLAREPEDACVLIRVKWSSARMRVWVCHSTVASELDWSKGLDLSLHCCKWIELI